MGLEELNRQRAADAAWLEDLRSAARVERAKGKELRDVEDALVRKGCDPELAVVLAREAGGQLEGRATYTKGLALLALGVGLFALAGFLHWNRQRHLEEAIHELERQGGGFFWDNAGAAFRFLAMTCAGGFVSVIFGINKLRDAHAYATAQARGPGS